MHRIGIDLEKLKISLFIVLVMYVVFFLLTLAVNLCLNINFYHSHKQFDGVVVPTLTMLTLQSLYLIVMSLYMPIYKLTATIFGVHLFGIAEACTALAINTVLHISVAYCLPVKVAIVLNSIIFWLWIYCGFMELSKL